MGTDALVGGLLLLALGVVVGMFLLDCSSPIIQTVPGTVVKKAMSLDISGKVAGDYIYEVWVKTSEGVYKFTVDKVTFFSLEEGDSVKVGLAIGRLFGSLCTSPVLITAR